MVKTSDFLKKFLIENLPEALNAKTVNDILDLIAMLIEQKGYAPPDYYDYNDFGREAQKVYDDIYLYAEEDKEVESV